MRWLRHWGWVILVPLVSLVGLFAIGIGQVFFRYVLSYPLTWGEEIMRLLFIVVVFTGAAFVTRNRDHIVVDLVHIWMRPRLSPTAWSLYSRSVALINAAFFALCTYGSAQMMVVRWETVSPTISWWHVGYMYAIVALAMAACTAYSLAQAFGPTRRGDVQ